MGRPLRNEGTRGHADDAAIRDQEVVRANKELVAYFKGQRTEREARAALKIIKAFVREREHTDPKRRRPLPGTEPAAAARATTRAIKPPRKRATRRRIPRQVRDSTAPARSQNGEAVASDAPSRDEQS